MKRILIISFIFTFAGCSKDNAPDCFISTGETVTNKIELANFSRLTVNNEFNIIITEGSQQSISITCGENIFKEIDFDVIDNELTIKNKISCKWARPYDFPTIEITLPNLIIIEVIGGSMVSSSGTLTYPELTLISRDSNGDFNFDLNSSNLIVDANELTNLNLKGTVDQLNLNYSSGDGRFNAANLLATDAFINHNGTNQVVVSVVNSLTGDLRSTGDLIYVNQKPATIDINILNRGRLIDGTK